MTNKELKRCQYLWEKLDRGEELNKSEQKFYDERVVEFSNSDYHISAVNTYQMNKNIMWRLGQ